jgi:type IV fimbrial biogenesis protein FimT
MAYPAYKPRQLKRSSGLTIIELMITLVVLGVLLAIGLPEMRSFIVSNRLSSDVKGFVGLINYARSEAITRNQTVVICPKDAATNDCVNTATWGTLETEAFVDVDGTGTWTTGDVLLKTISAVDATGLERGFTRTAAGLIVFRSVGLVNSSHGLDIWAIKTGDTAYESKYGRRVCIGQSGRVSVIAKGATCANF